HDAGKIDAVNVQREFVGEYLGRHRLAGTAWTREQRTNAKTAGDPLRKSPGLINFGTVRDLRGNLAQKRLFGRRKDELVPPPPAAGSMRGAKSASRRRACERHAFHSRRASGACPSEAASASRTEARIAGTVRLNWETRSFTWPLTNTGASASKLCQTFRCSS